MTLFQEWSESFAAYLAAFPNVPKDIEQRYFELTQRMHAEYTEPIAINGGT